MQRSGLCGTSLDVLQATESPHFVSRLSGQSGISRHVPLKRLCARRLRFVGYSDVGEQT